MPACFDTVFDKVVLLLNTAGVFELGFVEEFLSIRAVLSIGYPARKGMHEVVRILTGQISPSGRGWQILSITRLRIMQLDLGAVGKGYIGDIIADLLKEKGVTSALLDIGGLPGSYLYQYGVVGFFHANRVPS